MRTGRLCTPECAALLLAGWINALAAQPPADTRPARPPADSPAATSAPTSPAHVAESGPAERLRQAQAWRLAGQPAHAGAVLSAALEEYPQDEPLWLAWIDLALTQRQWGVALERVNAALNRLGAVPALHYRAARAHLALGQVLGTVKLRELDGEAGQFRDGWLLLEPRGPRKFLAVPPAAALNQVRRALDGGLDEPGLHLLHAQIWERAGKPETAWAVLQSRAAVLVESGDPATLEIFARIALRAGALREFLHYSSRHAAACPGRSAEILCASYVAAADHYGQRGDAELEREFCYRALRLRPADAELCLRLADAEWTAGQDARAVPLYQRTLELAPAHPRRADILGRLASEPPPGSAQNSSVPAGR